MPNLYSKTVISQKKTAPNFQVQRYRGFSTVNRHTKNFALYDFELIKQDLLNHFYIRQGERLMNPLYGTVIWDLLFEPLTESVKNVILENVNRIINSDPRIKPGQVVVTDYNQGIQIQCTLTYVPYNIQQSLQLNFDQANGLLVA